MSDRNDRRPISALPQMLKDARFLRGLTLKEAGDAMGVAASTLMRWEKGIGNPSFDQLDRAAKWLGLAIDLHPRADA